jgi:hypothetical protein
VEYAGTVPNSFDAKPDLPRSLAGRSAEAAHDWGVGSVRLEGETQTGGRMDPTRLQRSITLRSNKSCTLCERNVSRAGLEVHRCTMPAAPRDRWDGMSAEEVRLRVEGKQADEDVRLRLSLVELGNPEARTLVQRIVTYKDWSGKLLQCHDPEFSLYAANGRERPRSLESRALGGVVWQRLQRPQLRHVWEAILWPVCPVELFVLQQRESSKVPAAPPLDWLMCVRVCVWVHAGCDGDCSDAQTAERVPCAEAATWI